MNTLAVARHPVEGIRFHAVKPAPAVDDISRFIGGENQVIPRTSEKEIPSLIP